MVSCVDGKMIDNMIEGGYYSSQFIDSLVHLNLIKAMADGKWKLSLVVDKRVQANFPPEVQSELSALTPDSDKAWIDWCVANTLRMEDIDVRLGASGTVDPRYYVVDSILKWVPGPVNSSLSYWMASIGKKFGGSMATNWAILRSKYPTSFPRVENGKFCPSVIGFVPNQPIEDHTFFECSCCGAWNACDFVKRECGVLKYNDGYSEERTSDPGSVMRCGYCLFRADDDVKWGAKAPDCLSFYDDYLYKLGGMFEELMTSNRLDRSELDGMADSMVRGLVANDSRLMLDYANANHIEVVKINPGMTTSESHLLQENFPSYAMVSSGHSSNQHAFAANFKRCSAVFLSQLLPHNDTIVDMGGYGFQKHHQCKADIHVMNPCSTIKDYSRTRRVNCSHTVTSCNCSFKGRTSAMAVESIYDMKPMEVTDFMERHDIEELGYTMSVGPNTYSNDLIGMRGQICRRDGLTFICHDNDNIPYWHSSELIANWWEKNGLEGRKYGYVIITLKQFSHYVIRIIKRLKYTHICGSILFTRTVNFHSHTFWMPTNNSLLASISSGSLVRREVKLNLQLLRTLTAFALTELKTPNELSVIALAYVRTNYVAPTGRISRKDVAGEMARDHVYLAYLLVLGHHELMAAVQSRDGMTTLIKALATKFLALVGKALVSENLTATVESSIKRLY
jgi:hypothetical protein